MSQTTEKEIFDLLTENLRLAVESANQLANDSRKTPAYWNLREQLKLIENCCRQAAYWRGDARWFNMGLAAETFHKKAGDWLRGYKDNVTGRRIPTPPGQKNQLFVMLAAHLDAYRKMTDMFRTDKTGIIGDILPALPTQHRRIGAPVPVSMPKSLILPPRYAKVGK